MVRRAAQHEIGTRLADLGAVEEQSDMGRLCMFTTHLQTMLRGFRTNGVAFLTILQALSHLCIVSHMVLHGVRPVVFRNPYVDVGAGDICR